MFTGKLNEREVVWLGWNVKDMEVSSTSGLKCSVSEMHTFASQIKFLELK